MQTVVVKDVTAPELRNPADTSSECFLRDAAPPSVNESSDPNPNITRTGTDKVGEVGRCDAGGLSLRQPLFLANRLEWYEPEPVVPPKEMLVEKMTTVIRLHVSSRCFSVVLVLPNFLQYVVANFKVSATVGR
jgi:hypothetical protein